MREMDGSLVGGVGLFFAIAGSAVSYVSAQPTELVSRVNGVQPSGLVAQLAAIDDGRHVFYSSPDTLLVPGASGYQLYALERDPDGNGVLDEGNTLVTLISLGVDGLPANQTNGGQTGFYDIGCSAEGRFVLFSSQSDNLIPGDLSFRPWSDIFLHDRDPDGNAVYDEGNGVTSRVNEAFGGGEANWFDNGLDQLAITPDGRFAVFSSGSSNLVAADSNDITPNIYLRELATGVTTRVDRLTSTQNVGSRYADISDDGQWICYTAFADGFNTLETQVVVVDSTGLNPVYVSVDDSGALGDADSGAVSPNPGCRISPDGRYVAFVSFAGNLDVTRPTDRTNFGKLMLHDRDADGDGIFDEPGAVTTRRIDVAPNGDASDGAGNTPSFSPDSTRIAFRATASNLVPGDTTPSGAFGVEDLYIYTIATGSIEIASRASDGTQSNNSVGEAAFAGSEVLFDSRASNLSPNDTDFADDIFARTLAAPACNAADLAPPLGTLDLADIGAFVTGFTMQDPASDLNADGTWDLADIALFTTAFVAGCP